jgi:hypothetical protein
LKRWFSLTCPVCGFRYTLKKFKPQMQPIAYPVAIMSGGGRRKGFAVEQYVPWKALPTLKPTGAWNSLLYLYDRLGAAYDHFYEILDFLSPEIKKLLQEPQRSYAYAYRTNPLSEYAHAYASTQSLEDIAEPYDEADYLGAYPDLLSNQVLKGV